MKQTALRTFYQERKSHFSAEVQSLNKSINLIANLRIAVALAFLTLAYFAFSKYDLFYALVPLLVAFIVLVRKHSTLFTRKTHAVNLLRIQENELAILDGDYSRNASGSAFADVRHPFTNDLDIFGEGSLFQFINRCHTLSGKQRLAQLLSTSPSNAEAVRARQEAIKELAERTDLRQEIEALSIQVDEQPDDLRALLHWRAQPSFIYGKAPYRFVLTFFPVITVVIVIAAFLVDGLTGYAILSAGLQWIFLGFHLKRVNAFHQYIGRKKNILEKYAHILASIHHEKFTSPLMVSAAHRAKAASQQLKTLAGLSGALDARLNSMMNLLVNSLLLYDLQCVYRLEKWKETHADHLPQWLQTVHDVEALCSLATFAHNHPGFTFPNINTEGILRATGLGHPLLPETHRVTNDLALDKARQIMIITGANMAGKSTFLRAVGVNVVLAGTGAPVCATEFDCPVIELRSGMRTADSLRDHESYFYAELDRLKSIMDELRAGKSLLILLDEILKGTNSIDKQTGSIALVRQLTDHACLALIATHDLALGDLANEYPGRIVNYAFEANIENDELSFDYKLHPGLAEKMNATFLMRKMGIIRDS